MHFQPSQYLQVGYSPTANVRLDRNNLLVTNTLAYFVTHKLLLSSLTFEVGLEPACNYRLGQKRITGINTNLFYLIASDKEEKLYNFAPGGNVVKLFFFVTDDKAK